MSTFIALFRGINVGGHNILSMKELRTVLKNLGLENIKTYIQSGNAVFQSKTSHPNSLSHDISAAINNSHGFTPQVLLLPLEELQQAVASNPFPEGESEPKTVHLFFLATTPDNPDVEKLETLKTDTERFRLIGRVFYLHAPDGIGRSKVATNVEKAMGVAVTARNWRSVNKIMSMAADLAS